MTLVIVLAIRTRRRIWESRPGRDLLLATLFVIAITLFIPWSPLSGVLGFAPLPASFFGTLVLLLAAYVMLVELTKRWFYRH